MNDTPWHKSGEGRNWPAQRFWISELWEALHFTCKPAWKHRWDGEVLLEMLSLSNNGSARCHYNGCTGVCTHTFIKNDPGSWENREKTGKEVEERGHEQTRVPAGCFHMCLHTACVCLSISPHSLLSPPGLPTMLAALSPIPAVRTAFLTRQPQLSGCQGLRARSALWGLLHAPGVRQSQGGHKYHGIALEERVGGNLKASQPQPY